MIVHHEDFDFLFCDAHDRSVLPQIFSEARSVEYTTAPLRQASVPGVPPAELALWNNPSKLPPHA